MAQVPNVEGTDNAFVATGGQFGTIIANSTTETLGFYGAAGVAQQSANGVTTVAGVLALLEALNLVRSGV